MLLQANISFAKQSKNSQLHINSDEVTVDQTKYLSHFSGNVVVWLDDIMLKTSEILATGNKNTSKRNIDHLSIDHHLALTQNDRSYVIEANSAAWSLNNMSLTLSNDVRIKFNDNIVKCDKLIYLVPK